MAASSKFPNKDLVYYAGLFHDIGKLNPYYQELFTASKSKKDLEKIYDPVHAPYSRWIAEKILNANEPFNEFSYEQKQKILMMVYSHHGHMTNTPGTYSHPKKVIQENTMKILIENWKEFVTRLSTRSRFDDLKLNFNMQYNDNIEDGQQLCPENKDNYITEYIELCFLFSILLQADKSSFGSFEAKKIDFHIDTNKLKKEGSLNHFRDGFQKHMHHSYKSEKPITVIRAPTGIGKTKAFLDLIPKFNSIDRVFYFSPLLALTNDFEGKIKCTEVDQTQILTYNHVYSGTLDRKPDDKSDSKLDEKLDENNDPVWNINHEAFNEKFVITTMHRLLMTIYSSRNMDKLKLASFRNALLIVDEVQTMPKFLLKNLISIFEKMNEMIGTKVLLISATVPHELRELPTISMEKEDEREYLSTMKREIQRIKDIDTKLMESGKNLIMFNTRRQAASKFLEINLPDAHYISSGIKKRQQRKVIESIEERNDSILISTQVVEAGVDISFRNIWRQMAPLDNIVQVLGRLNRENEYKTSTLFVFDSDNDNHKPYSSLEYKTSQKYLSKITNSLQLYDELENYYKDISMDNEEQKEDSENFEDLMRKLDFKKIWMEVYEHLSNNYYSSVYIPDPEEWEETRADLLSNKKTIIKKYADIQALLPLSPYNEKIRGCFDEELFEKKIYYPKKDKIKELYDEKLGLDIWLTK